MNTSLFVRLRRRLLALVVAAALALTTSYASVLLDAVAGADMTPAAFACPHSGGGC